MSSGLKEELIQLQGYVQWPGCRTLSRSQGYDQWSEGKTLSRSQGYDQWSEGKTLSRSQRYDQWSEGKTLSCVRGISSGLEVELCPTSRVCPVAWMQNSFHPVSDGQSQGLVQCSSGITVSSGGWRQNSLNTNPQVYVETPLHPEKPTVWCALWAVGIIGPYFFKNDEGHNVTVNGDRYRAMITNFFIPELNNHDVQELWFQQDGATCHTACATINLLKDTFGDRLISRFGPVTWPPRSCDLTPLDYFLWGYVKSLVYADKPQTLDHLEDNIRRVTADIRPQMLEKVIENWTSRLDYMQAKRGSPMPDFIFKM
ncbi:transposable element Tc3 transposase [Trichonephila clavipes]|nr:transposable element Tc3 transposase [Trichonephila clavipes]